MEGENNGDNKVIKVAGSGLGVGICKAAHENVMSHKHIAGDHKDEGGICQGNILALCNQRGERVYTSHR